MSGMTAALEAAEAGTTRPCWWRRPVNSAASRTRCGSALPSARRTPRPSRPAWTSWRPASPEHPLITVHLNTTLAETGGAPGRFTVKLAQESGSLTDETVGAIVQTTGFTTYDIEKLPELGGGQPNVVDQAGLEALAKQADGGAIKRADGKEVKSVVFVQCAGQRDTSGQHLPYCSGHCCGTSIKQAMYFKDANPDVETVVLYDDLRVPGMGEDFYRSAQQKGVLFRKAKASKVTGGDSCQVTIKDLILDGRRRAPRISWFWPPAWCRTPASTRTSGTPS
jgi:quinone-modifying oxidoreductase, subunit QmoB